MGDYQPGPGNDDFELTVFGPGYGEAIAVHLGGGAWMLVDSCIHTGFREPASLHYLTALGVPDTAVKVIVASHWHDDHVRGISRLLAAYPNAEFIISGVFNDREALAFLEAYGDAIAPGQTRGTKELVQALRGRQYYFADQRAVVFEDTLQQRRVQVLALSPTAAARAQAIRHFAAYIPSGGSPINHAPELAPNIESVVIHIDLEEDAVLLGADLENHGCGWAAVVGDRWCLTKRRASAYKVAHHGSISGHHPDIWARLLNDAPVVSMTPFSKGSQNLPTEEDRARIRSLSRSAYISSGASRRPAIDAHQLKRMGTMATKLTPVNPGFGAVRFRKKFGTTEWRIELFGNARSL